MDLKETLKWCTKAAENGNELAQYKEKENDNWKKLREMASNTKSIVFLKATMNDKEHGLDYYLG